MSYEIEKGIPIPERVPNGKESKYPFKEMEIGDSFFIPEDDADKQYAKRMTYGRGKKLGMKFVVRTLENGVRIWRSA